jgi:glycosyltransferase involved in cell wall biosynthesis
MRALHVVKTSEGALWAARQAQVLTASGVDIHVALPKPSGEAIAYWEKAGATIHVVDCSLPVGAPYRIRERTDAIRRLITEVAPDLIHSHFVTSTLMLRLALGKNHAIPRLFQVPGPLHLEQRSYRLMELASAGPSDSWAASSRYTQQIYLAAGINPERVYLSYYGAELDKFSAHRTGELRHRLGISSEARVVGNISYMYPPKYFLGQTKGLKGHEDLIEAISLVQAKRPDVIGVFVGGQWGGGTWYEERLQKKAQHTAGQRIIFAGRVPQVAVSRLWPDFDCVVHAPLSENCGGVVEPLASGVPTVATRVGGIPEVIIDGLTGWSVPRRDIRALAHSVSEALEKPAEVGRRTAVGQALVRQMFDIQRTGSEMAAIYAHLLGRSSSPPPVFDSEAVARTVAENVA